MPKVRQTEPIIIGGGLAGAAVAILLARAGYSVTLIERERTAHHKVCGEFISWEAVHYLRLLGIDLPSLGAQTIHSFRMISGRHVLNAPLPFEAWSLSRYVLDEALLTAAVRSGVNVERGTQVTGLHRERNEWVVETADGLLRTDKVFLATGKHDIRGWRRDETNEHAMIGFKMHFCLTLEQQSQLNGHVEIMLYRGGYAGLEMIEDGRANLCLVVNKNVYAKCGKSWQNLLEWLNLHLPHLTTRLRGAVALWPRPMAIYGIPYGFIQKPVKTDPGLFRLGDQTAVIPSFAGDGMSIALHSAFLSAECFLNETEAHAYRIQAWNNFHHPIRRAQAFSLLTSNIFGGRIAFLLLKKFPKLISSAIQTVRLERSDLINEL